MNEAERAWPIIQYWHDGKPPDYIVELLESFRVHNPEMPHLLFDALAAEELIAEYFGDREVAAFRSCAVPAMQADYFRYCAAAALGGLVCDADLRCRAGLHALMPAPGEGWLVLRPHGAIVTGVFAFGSAGHPLLDLTVRIATANIERGYEPASMATGPALWTTMYWARRLRSFDALDTMPMTVGPALWTRIYWRRRFGSRDAFDTTPESTWGEYARLCGDVIGGLDPLDHAFEGITIMPVPSEEDSHVQVAGTPLPYKDTDIHWTRFADDVYREPRRPS